MTDPTSIAISAIALIVSICALAVSIYVQVWNQLVKPFKLEVKLSAVLWYPPAVDRPDTRFALAIPLTFLNTGARGGWIRGIFAICRSEDKKRVYPLMAVATLDLSEAIKAGETGQAGLTAQGLAHSVVVPVFHLQGGQRQDACILFLAPSADWIKIQRYDAQDTCAPGRYYVEIWTRENRNWTKRGEVLQEVNDRIMEGLSLRRLAFNIDTRITNELTKRYVLEHSRTKGGKSFWKRILRR